MRQPIPGFVETSHGLLRVEDHGGAGLPLLCLHGNSTSREVFARQVISELGWCRRLITLDLPGHGESENARDPVRTYTRPGLANAVAEVIEAMALRELAVLGWSLGGHIALELLDRPLPVKGLVLTGAPPTATGEMSKGFRGAPPLGSAGRKDLTPAEVDGFAAAVFGQPVPPFVQPAMVRTDGRFRERLFQAQREGAGLDQRRLVETNTTPIAVINGEADALINLDYIDTVDFAHLWRDRQHRLPGGHAVFWHSSGAFNTLVDQFLEDIETGVA